MLLCIANIETPHNLLQTIVIQIFQRFLHFMLMYNLYSEHSRSKDIKLNVNRNDIKLLWVNKILYTRIWFMVGLCHNIYFVLTFTFLFRYMKKCHFPIQEAERLSSQDPCITTEVNILRKDVNTHICTAKSSMARVAGRIIKLEWVKMGNYSMVISLNTIFLFLTRHSVKAVYRHTWERNEETCSEGNVEKISEEIQNG